jgi:hypothetical protein
MPWDHLLGLTPRARVALRHYRALAWLKVRLEDLGGAP